MPAIDVPAPAWLSSSGISVSVNGVPVGCVSVTLDATLDERPVTADVVDARARFDARRDANDSGGAVC